MARNAAIEIRLSKELKERIKNEAKQQGYGSTSQFIRDVSLNRNVELAQKIKKIHETINEILGLLKEIIAKNAR